MRKDLAYIVGVMDRSGSMQSCRADAEGGLNAFVKAQQAQPDDAQFTLYQFDHICECVIFDQPIKYVGRIALEPRGRTALLDALGRAITEVGQRLASLCEAARPGLVVFVIVTDGQENASYEYTKTKIRELIQHQESKYSWQFVYLGANQDAFSEASSLGIVARTTAAYDTSKSLNTYCAISDMVSDMRFACSANQDVKACAFSDDQRKDMI